VRHAVVARIVEAYDLAAARLEREKAAARAARQQPGPQEQEAEDGE
jgi:phosphate starvation-inducible PhoH-like protein